MMDTNNSRTWESFDELLDMRKEDEKKYSEFFGDIELEEVSNAPDVELEEF